MNRVEAECAVISMGDVALCIKLVDDMITEGTPDQQVHAVQILEDIFQARYNALADCVCGEPALLKMTF